MLAEWVEARDRPAPVEESRLAAHVGVYEGDREVRLKDGHLEYRRGQRMTSPLVPVTGERFSLDGEARFEFSPGSPSPELTIEQADGTRASYRRADGGR